MCDEDTQKDVDDSLRHSGVTRRQFGKLSAAAGLVMMWPPAVNAQDATVVPDAAAIEALVGHKFPGGNYTVAHWENFLLTECTGAELLPDGMVHPVVMFHMPIAGANTSIGEMFALGQAESDFSIGIESYDWEFFQPILEEVTYEISGRVTQADRRGGGNNVFDRIQFQFDVASPQGAPVARSTITWIYGRTANAS